MCQDLQGIHFQGDQMALCNSRVVHVCHGRGPHADGRSRKGRGNGERSFPRREARITTARAVRVDRRPSAPCPGAPCAGNEENHKEMSGTTTREWLRTFPGARSVKWGQHHLCWKVDVWNRGVWGLEHQLPMVATINYCWWLTQLKNSHDDKFEIKTSKETKTLLMMTTSWKGRRGTQMRDFSQHILMFFPLNHMYVLLF